MKSSTQKALAKKMNRFDRMLDDVINTLSAFNNNQFGVERVKDLNAAVFGWGIISGCEGGKVGIHFGLGANATAVALITQILFKYRKNLKFIAAAMWADTEIRDQYRQLYFEAEAYREYAKELLAIADNLDGDDSLGVNNNSTH